MNYLSIAPELSMTIQQFYDMISSRDSRLVDELAKCAMKEAAAVTSELWLEETTPQSLPTVDQIKEWSVTHTTEMLEDLRDSMNRTVTNASVGVKYKLTAVPTFD